MFSLGAPKIVHSLLSKKVCNHPINHIGLAVPDLETAEKWYMDVLGFKKLSPSITEDKDVNPDTAVFKICPSSLRKVRITYLSTGNGVGLELFKFLDPKVAPGMESSFETGQDFTRAGFFHISVTVPDVDKCAEKAVANGGKRVAQTVHVFGEDGVFITDPWGNGLEIISCSWEQLLCNRDGTNLLEDRTLSYA